MMKVQTTRIGNVAVLCLRGKIVRGELDPLRQAVLAQKDANVVMLDLAQVSTIDAGGLGVMLQLRQQTESRGVEFRLRNVTKLVRRVLEITRLDSVFDVRPTEMLPSPAVMQFNAATSVRACA